jgi:subtilase family serine protease
MLRRLIVVSSAIALTVPLTLVVADGAAGAPSPVGTSHRSARVCQTPAAGEMACNSLVVVDGKGAPLQTATPAGYGPGDLLSAYKLTGAAANGAGETVAIVDAYDDPNALSDVNTYRSQFGIPQFGSSGGPTFTKVNQTGLTSSLPKGNASWAEEISLDLDMVSAICPRCNVLLVEAQSANFGDLGTAVDTAANWHGVVAVSNSYGGSESSGDSAIAGHYNHPGVAITASSGDDGYGVESPASFATVTAVGGTSLSVASSTSRGWSETAWSGAGSGCSAYVDQPAWQAAALPPAEAGVCAKRVVADVSAVADPNTGVAVYDTYGLSRRSAGWLVFGGTSVASPIIASVYALAGGEPAGATGAEHAYANPGSLFDVTSGSNGSCSSTTTAAAGSGAAAVGAASRGGKGGKPGHGGGGGSTAPNTYLCQAGAGYDGPTGLGTPNGVGAF